MQTLEGTEELCFPHLLNSSCRRLARTGSNAMLISLSFIVLLTVALNLLVIISISHFRQLHTPTNLLLLSLAVSDLLVGLLLMPVAILVTIDACWFLGDLMCSLFVYSGACTTSASVGNIVLISIDRHVAICDPLSYLTKITLKRVQIYISLCWVCSLLHNVMFLKEQLSQADRYNPCYGKCQVVVDHISGLVDFVVTFIIPVAVILVLYTRVFVVAVSQARAMRSHITAIQPGKVTVTAKKYERKAARTLGIVIIVFLICFCPYYYSAMADQDNMSTPYYVLIWLFHISSCINPMIYAFFYPWFRKAIKLTVTLQILKPHSCRTKIL